MFDESFAVAMGLKKPEIIPLMEDFQDPEEYEKANEKFMKQMAEV